ncbi:MAG: 2OG-Fe(II) oxygenase [Sphingomonas sp.]|uniref:prolyl hydroxylase family protein n=1 Tax=Sphingomonas sp. TaxID=28214 RepID=UPI0025F769D1|nr:2OG-Fe(II) oxygenase [Sphingomonas sp.]MBX9881810.1 2OG-Fe(II) oxygenase [Sphingomonas sp.]
MLNPFKPRAKAAPQTSPLRAHIGAQVGARLDADPRVTRIEVPGVQAYYAENWLDPVGCAQLIALIDAGRRPSTVLSDNPQYGFRTSESCDLDRYSPLVQPIDEAISHLLGIDLASGETIQGQRYAPGQQFRAHHDYFFESEGYWERVKQDGGQRTWTAMIYLNDVEEGGATWFPQAGIRVAPKAGLLLIWNNMAADGSPNGLTLHEGMPVVAGVKYVVTKWFREGRWLPY